MYNKKEFFNFANQVIPYLNENIKRLGLEQAQAVLTSLTTDLARLNIIYPESENKNTKNHLIVEENRTLQIKMEKEIATIQQLVKHGLAPLTSDDISIIRLNMGGSQSTIPDPTDIVELSVVGLQKLIITVMISIGKLPSINYRSVFGRINDSAEIMYALTDASVLAPPTYPDAYVSLLTTKKANNALVFKDADAGKRLWLMAFFLNPRGKEGPVGVPISVIIPG